jgi:WD40 repeat protein
MNRTILLVSCFFCAALSSAQDVRFDVWSIAITSDGKTIAAGGGLWDSPGEIGIWDLATKKPLQRFAEDLGVGSIVFSPDGKLLASGCWSGGVRVREWATATEVAHFDVDHVSRLAMSPKGDYLVSATERKKVQLWDLAKRKLSADLEGDMYRFHCAAFSLDGRYAMAGGGDWGKNGFVVVWDVATKKQVKKFAGHQNSVVGIGFAPDGKIMATTSIDGTVRVWDWETAQELKILRGHGGWVESALFTPDGKTLISGATDRTVRFWDWQNGVENTKERIMLPHSVRCLQFTPDGAALIVAGGDKSLRFIDVATHKDVGALWNGTNVKTAMDELPVAVSRPAADGGEAAPRLSWRTLFVIAVVALIMFALLLGWFWNRSVPKHEA